MANENTEDVDSTNNEGEGEGTTETISIPKSDYEKMNQTLGSLKRELKDLKKPKEESVETPKQTKTDDSALLQRLERLSLTQSGISHKDDIELARTISKKWGMPIEDVLADEDFKVKLERQQTQRQNLEATTQVKGSGSSKSVQDSPEYWLSKGSPDGLEKITDRKKRAEILRAFAGQKSGKTPKFYNTPK